MSQVVEGRADRRMVETARRGLRPATAELADPRTGRIAYIPGLDGMRGIGMILVLLAHMFIAQDRIVREMSPGAWLTISMFFTLSGFLITLLMIAEYEGSERIALGAFWERRARRLLPALFVSLAAIMVLSMLGLAEQQPGLGKIIVSTVFYQWNTYFVYHGFALGNSLGQMWSLSIEEQFYVIFPLLFVLFVPRIGRRAVWVFALLALASFAYALKVASANTLYAYKIVYYSTPSRACELLLGVVLAFVVTSDRFRQFRALPTGRLLIQVVGVVAFVALLLIWQFGGVDPWWRMPWLMLANGIASSLVIVACLGAGPVTKVTTLRPLKWVGKVSYGAYVYHIAIFFLISGPLLRPESGPVHNLIFVVLRIAVVLVVAGLSYRYIEVPLRRSRVRGRTFWLGCGAAAVALSATALALPFPPGRTFGYTPARRAASTSAPNVVVLGDGLAQRSLAGLEELGSSGETSFRVVPRTESTCPLLGSGTLGIDGQARDSSRACAAWWFGFGAAGREKEGTHLRPDPHATVVLQMGTADLLDRVLPDGSVGHLGEAAFDAWALQQLGGRARSLGSLKSVIWVTLPEDASVLDLNRVADTAAPTRTTAAQDRELAASPAVSGSEALGRISRLNALIRRAASGHPNITVVDGFSGTRAAWEALLAEHGGIHPNSA